MNCIQEIFKDNYCRCTVCNVRGRVVNGECVPRECMGAGSGLPRNIVSKLECVLEISPGDPTIARCVRGGCGRKFKIENGKSLDQYTFPCKGTGPSEMRKAVNVTKAVAKHIATGMVIVSKEVEERRASVCPGCDLYMSKDGGKTHYCSHMNCGCGVDQIENYLSKLKLESEKCPHPKGNKWEMTDEKLKEIGHPENVGT